jgi:hypothetical protein
MKGHFFFLCVRTNGFESRACRHEASLYGI